VSFIADWLVLPCGLSARWYRTIDAVSGSLYVGDATRVGVTRQAVVAIEQGRYSPSLEMAFQIAHVLGVSLEDVFQYPQPEGDQP
jgi:hypothetical protein